MLATNTLSTFPKFELAVIFIYFMMLPKTMRPSITPFASTSKSFSSKIISADSFAISTAVSTEIPTSDSRIAAASLIPSPIYPTVCPLFLSASTMRAFWIGSIFAKTVVPSASRASAASSSASMSLPSMTFSTIRSTS